MVERTFEGDLAVLVDIGSIEDVFDHTVRILERCKSILAQPLPIATSILTMVHLDQAIFERGQVDIALLLSVQLLPQRLDPGIPLLSGLAIHSRVFAVLSWFHG